MTAPARTEPQLEFFEDDHVYKLDGVKVPSVTQILSFGQDLSRIPAWTAQRGTALHLATEYDDAGDLDEDSVDPLVRPHLIAYRKWKEAVKYNFIETEYRVWGEVEGMRYCGTIDRVGVCGRDLLRVLDLKSGAPRREHGAQVCAYARAYEQRHGRPVFDQGCVYLDKSGEWSEKTYDPRDGHADYFMTKLRAYYEAQS